MGKSRNIDIKSILRWIVFLPAAAIAGFLVYNIVWYMQSFTTWVFVGSGPMADIYFIRFFSYLCMGIATVYVACLVAPSSKKSIAVIMGGLVLILSGATMFYALSVPEYLGVLDSIAMDLGAIGIATAIYNEQTELI